MKDFCKCCCSAQSERDQKDISYPYCCPVCFCIRTCDDHHHDKDCGQNGNNGNGPNRPGKSTGTNTGRIPNGSLITPGDLDGATPPIGSWSGPRKFLQLPFLFLRANAADNGTRPVIGPFWESPDIIIAAGVDPSVAPPRPDKNKLGDVAIANQPNTIYAHVWNFGLVCAPNVIVEFRWCNPSLGINQASAQLIGYNRVSLGSRESGHCHKVVKCPKPWFPAFLNGGHECLLVRVWEETSDGLSTPEWDASLNRHIGQRNIHVMQASQPMAMRMIQPAGIHPVIPAVIKHSPPQIALSVGPLYGAPAQVSVARVAPHTMPWLQMKTGQRGLFPAQAATTGQPSLTPPSTIGGKPIYTGVAAAHTVNSDDQQVIFTTNDNMPAPGEAHVYRVVASQNGQIFGGYTIVMTG